MYCYMMPVSLVRNSSFHSDLGNWDSPASRTKVFLNSRKSSLSYISSALNFSLALRTVVGSWYSFHRY